MKRYVLLLMTSLICFVSCYDDSELRASLQDHENRIANLELLCDRMNTNISSMQTLLEAVQNNDYVKSIAPIMGNDKEVGYTITFTKSEPITIYHGQNGIDGKPGTDGHSPVIGVKQDTNGIYYWTLDGSWLLDDNGNKIKAIGTDGQNGSNGQDGRPGADGITPQLRIMEGYWEISYDNGSKWTRLGKATGENGQNGADGQNGDSFFQSVTDSETDVTFVLASGATIVLPKEKKQELTIAFDDFDIGMIPGATVRVGYTIQGIESGAVIKVIANNGWSATVEKTSEVKGELVVTAPDPLVEDEILVFVSNGKGLTTMSSVNFVTGVITTSVEAIEASLIGGEYELNISTNLDYIVDIPEKDKNWLTIAPQTKAMRTDKLTLVIAPNKGDDRQATISIKNMSGIQAEKIVITQSGGLVVNVNGIELNLVKVQGGTFTMGATPEQGTDVEEWEKPTHQVTLSDYYIGQFHVTQELWEAVMGANPSKWKNPKNPVECVSWNDIVNEFLPKLNVLTGKTFTLPTEAQWEFAARGGNKSKGYKYSGSNNIDEVAWYNGNNSPSGTKPVGQKLPNELGIYDMSGNVWEWCSDWKGSYSAEAQIDPTGPASGSSRVFRGGSYFNYASDCRVSNRNSYSPSDWYYNCGFRLVLNSL